jgi:hypothetical protein
MRDEDKDYLDDFFSRPPKPVNSETEKRRFVGIVVGRRPTPSGGIAQTLEEVKAAGKIKAARDGGEVGEPRDGSEIFGPNMSGVMGDDSRWPLSFHNMDGTLDNVPKARRDGTFSPLTEIEERHLRDVWGITPDEWRQLMTRGPIK